MGPCSVANMQGEGEAGWRRRDRCEGLKIFRSAGVWNRLPRAISERNGIFDEKIYFGDNGVLTLINE
jgi:hypothetical protein